MKSQICALPRLARTVEHAPSYQTATTLNACVHWDSKDRRVTTMFRNAQTIRASMAEHV